MANQISSSENERGDDHVDAGRRGVPPPVGRGTWPIVQAPAGSVRRVSLQRMGAAAISMPHRRKPSPRMGSLAAWSGYRYVPSDAAGGLSRGGYHLDVPRIRGPPELPAGAGIRESRGKNHPLRAHCREALQRPRMDGSRTDYLALRTMASSRGTPPAFMRP